MEGERLPTCGDVQMKILSSIGVDFAEGKIIVNYF